MDSVGFRYEDALDGQRRIDQAVRRAFRRLYFESWRDFMRAAMTWGITDREKAVINEEWTSAAL